MFVILANNYAEQTKVNNTPLLTLSNLHKNLDKLMLDESMPLKLIIMNNKMFLLRSSNLKPQALFESQKDTYEHIKLFYKDIDFDGSKELIILVQDKMFVSDIYIFSNLNNKTIKKYKKTDFIIGGDSLRFTNKEEMFIRSCGSQYCNDAYYIWDGVSLKSEYTDSYESM